MTHTINPYRMSYSGHRDVETIVTVTHMHRRADKFSSKLTECGASTGDPLRTTQKRESVTCGSCKRSAAYKSQR